MQKRAIVLLVALVAVAAAVYAGVRLSRRGTDIIGVTTLSDRVIMNAKTGKEFVSGSGKLTVAEGEGVRLDYDLKAGSFDFALHRGSDGLDVFDSADLDNLGDTGEVYGRSGVSGSGSLDFPAEPGEYTVYFRIHDTVGTATVRAK